MSRDVSEIDDYFLLDVILVFLLINYNMPLATIYSIMVIVDSMMYLVPVQFNLFNWISFRKPGTSWIMASAIGAGFGLAFIFFYNSLTKTPMAAIFATTLFGDSKILTTLVYVFLITLVETRFFFRTIMQWWSWKIGDNVFTASPFSATGAKLMAFFGAVFTIFHATAKGIESTGDLFATFVFGALSVGMILYEWIQAFVMHVIVNAKGMGLLETLKNFGAGAGTGSIMIGVIALLFWLTQTKSGQKLKLLN